jgi:hypothetical protein
MECDGEELRMASWSGFEMAPGGFEMDFDGNLAALRPASEFAAPRPHNPPQRSVAFLRQNPAQGEAFDEKRLARSHSQQKFRQVKAPEGDLYQSDTALCHAGRSDRFTDSWASKSQPKSYQ